MYYGGDEEELKQQAAKEEKERLAQLAISKAAEREINYRKRYIQAQQHVRHRQGKPPIIYVESLEKMQPHIDRHDKIGFILQNPEPLYAKYLDIGHCTPIYFERTPDKKEYFIQLDCHQDSFLYALPNKQGINRTQYYSKFQRMTAEKGCFEDAYEVLDTCLSREGLLAFCKHNSAKAVLPMAPANAFCKLRNHLAHNNIIDIRHLTSLPQFLMRNMEHYGTMRHFRTTRPVYFTTKSKRTGQDWLDIHLITKDQIRVLDKKAPGELAAKHQPKPLPEERKALLEKITSEEKTADFRGESFEQRHNAHFAKTSYHATVGFSPASTSPNTKG